MGLRIKSINWKEIKLPAGVNTKLFWITSLLQGTNWNFIQYEPSTYKMIISNGTCKMSIYISTMTIQTALNHPKKGKTQLTRKNINQNEFATLLKDPRFHTGKGKY